MTVECYPMTLIVKLFFYFSEDTDSDAQTGKYAFPILHVSNTAKAYYLRNNSYLIWDIFMWSNNMQVWVAVLPSASASVSFSRCASSSSWSASSLGADARQPSPTAAQTQVHTWPSVTDLRLPCLACLLDISPACEPVIGMRLNYRKGVTALHDLITMKSAIRSF